MDFKYSLHIEHFIDIEIFFAIRHEVTFLREENVPTCKIGKLGDPTGGGTGDGGGGEGS